MKRKATKETASTPIQTGSEVVRKDAAKRTALLVSLSLAALTLLTYLRVFSAQFVNYDDNIYVYENKVIQHGLTWNAIKWAFTTNYAANWHPLTWLSHMLDISLFGMNPAGHHAVNLLIHILNVVILFLLLRRMTGSTWKSAFVAGLFALHPLHVQSVAWIAERKDLLSTFFGLLTIWAYASYAERPSVRKYVPMALLFALGLMAKPMLVTLPFLLLLLDYWPLGRVRSLESSVASKEAIGNPAAALQHSDTQSLRRLLVLEKIPLFLMSGVSCYLTYWAQKNEGAVPGWEIFPMSIRIDNAFVSCFTYIGKMFWPARLAVFYPHARNLFPIWIVITCAVLLFVTTALAIFFGRKTRYLAMGWLWYLITLGPVIGLVQVGAQGIADRYTYVPMIGLFVILAWGVPDVLGRVLAQPRAIRAMAATGGTVLAALSVISFIQIGYWQDTVVLFQHAIAVTSDNALMKSCLGIELLARKRPDEAIPMFREAVRTNPTFAQEYVGIGKALVMKNQPEDAISAYKCAIAVKPDYMETYFLLAQALGSVDKWDEAISVMRKAAELQPNSAPVHADLAHTLGLARKFDEAISESQIAIRLDPNTQKAHEVLATAYFYKQEYAKAWESVHQGRSLGFKFDDEFVAALSEKMPDPGN
jgi:tetratricopeptide (TPR) repeat protein